MQTSYPQNEALQVVATKWAGWDETGQAEMEIPNEKMQNTLLFLAGMERSVEPKWEWGVDIVQNRLYGKREWAGGYGFLDENLQAFWIVEKVT